MIKLGISSKVFSWVLVLSFMLSVNAYSQKNNAYGKNANETGVLSANPNQAFTFKLIDPAVWPRAEADLGIEGFVIEDFEDETLEPGLLIELSDSNEGFVRTNKLPMAFHPKADDPNEAKAFAPGVWDGSRVLINRYSKPPSDYIDDFGWGDVTFHIPGGASSFGCSLQNIDLDAELSVNGVSLGFLPTSAARNGYLRIYAARGKIINSVKIANSGGDGISFDHVAFKPIRRTN